jgi:hypothetical protein
MTTAWRFFVGKVYFLQQKESVPRARRRELFANKKWHFGYTRKLAALQQKKQKNLRKCVSFRNFNDKYISVWK